MTDLNPSGDRPPWYVTTAIPYVNAKPHIGFAQELILTDALARYHRLKGEDVWFLTGTDENSLKNVQSAEQEGIPTRVLVDRNAAHFYNLWYTPKSRQKWTQNKSELSYSKSAVNHDR